MKRRSSTKKLLSSSRNFSVSFYTLNMSSYSKRTEIGALA